MSEKIVNINAFEEVDGLVKNAQKALDEFLKLDQEQIDYIVAKCSVAGLDHHGSLAKIAIDETKRGVFEDKATKNLFACEYVVNNMRHLKTVGVISSDPVTGITEIADPIGVVAGITPVTNPTSTVIFKSLICLKTRNPIIFAFHPNAQQSSKAAAQVMYEAAVKAGAPKNCIQWIEHPSMDATTALMNHTGVATILATGGNAMVKAAYSCGKPAMGVGAGNVPSYINKSADVEQAVNDIVLSKSFDNGMICASEQAVIVDNIIKDKFERLMIKAGCYFANDNEKELLLKYMFNKENNSYSLNSDVVGKYPYDIADAAGFDIPFDTKVLIVKETGVGDDYPFSKEKLSPVLTYYISDNSDNAIDLCEKLIEYGGLGHSAVIHAEDQEVINHFSNVVKVGRIIVNSPSTHGAIGDIYNTNVPSLTLGCGTFGGNSTTDNVSSVNLINLKRVAKRQVNMQWFKVPPKIYFEAGSVKYLSKMQGISKALIVTDQSMLKFGYVDKVIYQLEKRDNMVHYEVFSDVEPDPSFDTINRGVEFMMQFEPDVIIALGGGSVIDASKGMWLFYEHPNVDKEGLKLKFLDIRKRTYKYPKLGLKAKFVAIPTTSGTGSEVTSFAVITDKHNNVKYPFADYELTPDVAIVDHSFVYTLPKVLTADTGMDVLTHAIEAYVSNMASDYTDGLAEKAGELIKDYLVEAYNNGENKEAREKVHNASCIAGMAFTNAFLGINHSLAHKIGAEFHISHGRCVAILMPYIIRYNSCEPTKFVSFPKYEHFIADKKYAKFAKKIGLDVKDDEDGIEKLIQFVKDIRSNLNIENSFKEFGLDEETYMSKIDDLANKAFEDQCTTANPRLPLVSELKKILIDAYYGIDL